VPKIYPKLMHGVPTPKNKYNIEKYNTTQITSPHDSQNPNPIQCSEIFVMKLE
jgi:hypothetical protein